MENKNNNPFSIMEEEVLDFWNKSKTFQKSLEKKAPKGNYVFYDGPPFITGLPHYATLLPSIAKDVVPRYWTMKGYHVERVWGWDCHGLPAENKVEQELGLKNKKDIEKLGVEKFTLACRSYVDNCSTQWKWYIDRIGRWVDMDNAYKTMDLNFMESVIWSFKELYNKNLIYEGYRSSLHCPRCATPLSKFEITMDAGSYKDVTEKSVVVKFKITNLYKLKTNLTNKINKEKIYLLAWTTTPWTLPGNMALAVGKDIDYVLIKCKMQNAKCKITNQQEFYILAKNRVDEILKNKEYKIIQEFKGEELVGLNYEPIFDLDIKEIKNNKNTFKIYNANFINTEEGTGIVHIAPNFGEDDFELGKKNSLPMVELMDENGCYTVEIIKTASSQACGEAVFIKNLYFKKVNKLILENLESNNLIFSSFDTTHSYPFCYRCYSPLIYKTQKAWYLKISKIREQLLESNKKINWIPEHFKYGRFQYNLESAPDWCISRSRYWATPIPVWKCEGQSIKSKVHKVESKEKKEIFNCGEIKIIGSIRELEKVSGKNITDLHKPRIDAIEFKCEKCGGVMKRVPEVLDCWFESGSAPYAQFHYPFQKKNEFKNIFPADFIVEYTGQLRGWFYYLHVLSNCLFNSVAFKNVIVTGVLTGTDGRKMSKSYGNYPDSKMVLEKYGSDALRMYFMASPIMLGGDMSFSEQDIQIALRKNIILLWNVVRFYELFVETNNYELKANNHELNNILDKWILIRLNQLTETVTKNLDKYNLPQATKSITDFIDDLSTWYLRRSRDRFKSDEYIKDTECPIGHSVSDMSDKQAALQTTKYVLLQLSKIIAPFMPFIAEQIWQKITCYNFKHENKSVHLEEWPSSDVGCWMSDVGNILKNMEFVRKIVELGLAKRDEAGIKVRQPLSQLRITNYELRITNDQYINLIKDELNVKKVEFVKGKGGGELRVELDIELSPELIQEGMKRELVRLINSMRKNAGLTIQDRIIVYWESENIGIKDVINKYKKEFLKDVLADEIVRGVNTDNEAGIKKEIEINKIKIILGIKKQ